VLDLLKEIGKLGVKPTNTLMMFSQKFDSNEEPLDDISQFQWLVGKLIYLIITRLDIAYAVSYVSQFMQKPKRAI
jgi:hypothetical protein